MKKIWLILGMLTCIFTMAACSSSETTKKASFDYDESTLKSTAEQYLESWNTTDFSEFLTEEYEAQMDETSLSLYTAWNQLQGELGKFELIVDTSIVESEDSVKAITRGKYANGQMDFTLVFDSASTIIDMKAEQYATMAEKMERAVLNTILGLGVVFVALIFISCVIALMKFIPVFLDKFSGSSAADKNENKAVDHVIASIAKQEEEELSDNLELVAVVTAAIMTSLGTEAPADGLIVRSIRRKK